MASSDNNNNSSNNKSWTYEYLGKSQRDGFDYFYRLETQSADNIDAKTPFDFSIHPKSLTVIKRPLPLEDENESLSSLPYIQKIKQKIAIARGSLHHPFC